MYSATSPISNFCRLSIKFFQVGGTAAWESHSSNTAWHPSAGVSFMSPRLLYMDSSNWRVFAKFRQFGANWLKIETGNTFSKCLRARILKWPLGNDVAACVKKKTKQTFNNEVMVTCRVCLLIWPNIYTVLLATLPRNEISTHRRGIPCDMYSMIIKL